MGNRKAYDLMADRIVKGEVLFWKGKRVGGRTIQIEGTDRLRRQLDRLDREMRKPLLERMVLEAGKLVQHVASTKAPRGPTGRLSGAEGMTTEVLESSARHATAGTGPTKDAFYGMFQEYGTARHGAQPFLRPAYDEQKRPAVKRMSEIGREAVRRAVR